MRYFDEITGEQILNPDLEKGKITEQNNTIVHTYVIDVEEEGHEEVIAEYPNGGKDVAWVIDIQEQGHWKTEDERGEFDWEGTIPDDAPHELVINDTERIGIYHTYTQEELDEIEAKKKSDAIKAEIAELKQKLINTDYIIVKESEELNAATSEEEREAIRARYEELYGPILIQRQQWRERINELEN